MAISSQSTQVQSMSDLTGLAHEIFASGVKWHVLANSPTAQLFNEAQRNSEYDVRGEALVAAAQLAFAGGAMATGGKLPRHQYKDAVQWQTTPVARYRRIAQDNFTIARASGPGVFQDLGEMIFDQLWDSWGRMEIRHAIGDSNGYVAKIASRTSTTVVKIKDGYGHAGTNPILHLEEGMDIAWLDASASYGVGGAGKISDISGPDSSGYYTITLAAAWDDGTTTPAAGDPVVFCTTTDSTADFFETEYQNCPHGVMGLVDPDDNFTTVLNINEDNNPRWKPFRESAGTFDHFELTEHWRKLRAKSTSPVGPASHAVITQGAPIAELARTLGGFQMQQNLGREFEGGYTAVRIAGQDFVEDDFFLHDVIVTLCTEDVYRADLEEADFYAEDGSQWSRLSDEDGQEAYVRQYMQTFNDRRNRHGAYTGIPTPNVDENDFTPVALV